MDYFLLTLAFLIPTGLSVFALYRIGQLFLRCQGLQTLIFSIQNEHDKKITALARSKGVTFTEHKCEVCGTPLDEKISRTHTGHYRCNEHKLAVVNKVSK